jgi:hypothetical protein
VKAVWTLYLLGIAAAALAGALSPLPWTGLLAVAAGLIWAAYDLIDVKETANGEPARKTSNRRR